MADEQWRPIKGHEGEYEVSDQGRVRSLDREVETADGRVRRMRGRVLRTHLFHGYLRVALSTYGLQRKRSVARLVYQAFIGRPPNMVWHKDGDPTNARTENLTDHNPMRGQRYGSL